MQHMWVTIPLNDPQSTYSSLQSTALPTCGTAGRTINVSTAVVIPIRTLQSENNIPKASHMFKLKMVSL
jgi:hypothetical protein